MAGVGPQPDDAQLDEFGRSRERVAVDAVKSPFFAFQGFAMRYLSTRGHAATPAFCDILLGGLAPDGGLYLPESYPQITRAELDAWHREYMTHHIRPIIGQAARELVQQHLDAGDLCAIVTATNSFVTGPIARELGIPAIVGCGDATETLTEGEEVTVSCTEGDTGHVYRGRLDFEVSSRDISAMPDVPVKVMMNVGNPELAFEFAQLPNAGVGLARVEFIINNVIGIHPKAILDVERLPASKRDEIKRRARGYASPKEFFVEKLVEGVSTIAAAFWPNPVIVRLSDFKSNEYRKLLGGDLYEPEEENPMLGFRGASRYIAQSFRDCFEMECRAMKKVREEMGLTNVQLMVPFVRTVGEGKGDAEYAADIKHLTRLWEKIEKKAK